MTNFFNKYPYTDFHELNADYLLERLKNIEDSIASLEDTIKGEVLEWVEEQLEPYKEQIEGLITEVNNLAIETEETLRAYDQRITDLVNLVNNELTDIREELITSIQAVNDLTDIKIDNNNMYLLNEITQNVGDLFVVLNPFTGETVTIQAMVDYLAAFHITDGISYIDMNTRALTYAQFNALGIDYTDLALHGNTIYN